MCFGKKNKENPRGLCVLPTGGKATDGEGASTVGDDASPAGDGASVGVAADGADTNKGFKKKLRIRTTSGSFQHTQT